MPPPRAQWDARHTEMGVPGGRGAAPPRLGAGPHVPTLAPGASCAALRRVAGKGKEAGDEALSRGAVTVGGPRGTGV